MIRARPWVIARGHRTWTGATASPQDAEAAIKSIIFKALPAALSLTLQRTRAANVARRGPDSQPRWRCFAAIASAVAAPSARRCSTAKSCWSPTSSGVGRPGRHHAMVLRPGFELAGSRPQHAWGRWIDGWRHLAFRWQREWQSERGHRCCTSPPFMRDLAESSRASTGTRRRVGGGALRPWLEGGGLGDWPGVRRDETCETLEFPERQPSSRRSGPALCQRFPASPTRSSLPGLRAARAYAGAPSLALAGLGSAAALLAFTLPLGSWPRVVRQPAARV